MSDHLKTHILLIGNPGVGKSTILNGLIGEARFQAGLAFDGSGVTRHLQAVDHEGITYLDTPGLDDDERRKECAEQINLALKRGGLYFVCFVVTMEAGRMRPSDKTTIKLVLDAAPQIGGQYSVIVNKLENSLYNHYTQNPQTFPTILSRGLPQEQITNSIFYFKHDPSLYGLDNAVFDIHSPAMTSFHGFLKTAPCVKIDPNQVKKIEEERWKLILDEYEKIIKHLHEQMKNQKAEFDKILQEERQRQEKQFEQVRAQQEAAAKAHQAELQRVQQQLNALKAPPPVFGGGGCFPSSALCILENGQKCKISNLKAGQKVYAIDDKGKLIVSEVYFVNGEPGRISHNFIYFNDKQGQEKRLIATDEHLIYACSEKLSLQKAIQQGPIVAKNIQVGDFLFVHQEGKMERCQVTRFEQGVAEGKWYALTLDHRLLVDNVLVSAYEINHEWGIADTTIMRGLYYLSPSFVNSEANKWFCNQIDQILEPIALYTRDLWSS